MRPDFKAALAKVRAAKATFDGFPPGRKREHLERVAEAKRHQTRARRIGQAVAWLAERKPRNWKHMKC